MLVLFAAAVTAAFAASTDFAEKGSSPEAVGIGPRGIVAADFDGDGDLDLATANVSAGTVTVLRNTGTGNFIEPASSPEAVGSFPDAIVAADLDGDGDPDLAVANQVSGDVTILRNKGNGNFVEPASSPEPAGSTPASITADDLDGDGDQDLAIANAVEPAGIVTILKNRGKGNFFQPASSPEAVGSKPVSVVSVDLDGDGDVDLATANQQSFNVTILVNSGSGNFAERTTSPEGAGTHPQGITDVDIDGDGDSDLVVANQTSNDLTILRNVGTGNFFQPSSSPEAVGLRPLTPVAAADFDLNGIQDLASANHDSDNVTVLKNRGAGNYDQVSTSPETAGDGPQGIVAADLDGDGDPDLAVANGNSSNVTILRNRP